MANINLLSLTTVNRKVLYQGQPGTTSGTLYTCPASTDVVIKGIVVTNTSATPATVTIDVGSASGATHRVLSAFTVGGNDTASIDTPIAMTAADVISGLQGTASAITVTITGDTYA